MSATLQRHGDSSSFVVYTLDCCRDSVRCVCRNGLPHHSFPAKNQKGGITDLRDTLAVLATVEDGPSYPARVLALKEKRLGLSVLEAEDLAVATDVQLTLLFKIDISNGSIPTKNPSNVCPIDIGAIGRRASIIDGGIFRCAGVVDNVVVSSRHNFSSSLADGDLDRTTRTYLAGVDLLAAERVVVGTHLDGGRCADGRLALRCWSEIEIHGSAITGPNCGAPR